jgi:hypothetical protein
MSDNQSIPPFPPINSNGNTFENNLQNRPLKTKKKKKILLIVIGGVVGLLILCIIIASLTPNSESPSPSSSEEATNTNQTLSLENTKVPAKNAPTDSPVPTNTPKPTLTPSKTPNPNLHKSGTYLVGTEIQPGLYKGLGSNCYWERLKDLSGSFDAIIANDLTDGQFYIQVDESDAALSTTCDFYLFDPSEQGLEVSTTLLNPGQYLVGSEVLPGIYRGTEEGCYWERLKDFSGDFDGIVANDNSDGQFYFQVKESDFAFSVTCPVNYIKEIPQNGGEYPTILKPGMYLIGSDIRPGTYKGQEEDCYWERLSNIFGDFNGIIANDITTGQYYIQVYETDFALSTNCQIEWVGE